MTSQEMQYPKSLVASVAKQLTDFRLEGFVPGYGRIPAQLMLVGEAPGRTELDTHKPFTGAAGRELDRWLKENQLSREQLYITSAVRNRPFSVKPQPNGEMKYPNRTPSKKEVAFSAPLLDYEIQQVKPLIIATLGNIGLQRLLGKDYTVSHYHGQLLTQPIQQADPNHPGSYLFTERSYHIVPLYHPAAVLYARRLEPDIVEDWHKLSGYLKELQEESGT